MENGSNYDAKVVRDFGDEWEKFNYTLKEDKTLEDSFNQYFNIFPWSKISKSSIGFDMGCGTGRWAGLVAPRVAELNLIDPSSAIDVAETNLKNFSNVNFFKETTSSCSLKTGSQDFGYSLGVLHHIPNTEEALQDCSRLLKKGAPFLLYLYYNFENKPLWFKSIWQASNLIRKVISRLPKFLKFSLCSLFALLIYFPLARISLIAENLAVEVKNIPLSDYRRKSFYQMRNDALDRFGTKLEKRFSKKQIEEMLKNTGFHKIRFSETTPYWTCIAFKK